MDFEKRKQMAIIDAKVEKSIQSIMKTHDKDSSGFLDKQEAHQFLVEILINLGLKQHISDEEFDVMFQNFDLNHDGVIQKSELKALIYTLSGLGQGKKNAQKGLEQLLEDYKKLAEMKRLQQLKREQKEKDDEEENEITAAHDEEIQEEQQEFQELEVVQEVNETPQQTYKQREEPINVPKPQEQLRQKQMHQTLRRRGTLKGFDGDQPQTPGLLKSKDSAMFQNLKERVEDIEKKENEIAKLEQQIHIMTEQSNDQALLQQKLMKENGLGNSNSLMLNADQQKLSKMRAQITDLTRRVDRERSMVMIELKKNFNYIRGANLGDDEAWKYEQSLYKKILKPARAVTSCQMVLKELLEQNTEFDSYLTKFKRRGLNSTIQGQSPSTSFDKSKVVSRYREQIQRTTNVSVDQDTVDRRSTSFDKSSNIIQRPSTTSMKFLKQPLFQNGLQRKYQMPRISQNNLEQCINPTNFNQQSQVSQPCEDSEILIKPREYTIKLNQAVNIDYNPSIPLILRDQQMHIMRRNQHRRIKSSQQKSPTLSKVQAIYFDSIKEYVSNNGSKNQVEAMRALNKPASQKPYQQPHDQLRLSSFKDVKLPQSSSTKIISPNNQQAIQQLNLAKPSSAKNLTKNAQAFQIIQNHEQKPQQNYQSFFTKSSFAVIEDPTNNQQNSRTLNRFQVAHSVQDKYRSNVMAQVNSNYLKAVDKLEISLSKQQKVQVKKRQTPNSTISSQRRDLLSRMMQHQLAKSIN